jgi:hypothetical protein
MAATPRRTIKPELNRTGCKTATMTNAIMPLDPDLPRQRRTVRSGLVYSGLSIALILFALGELPQIDAFFTSTDHLLRTHNDIIISAALRILPYVLVAIGSFGLIYKALGVLNKQGRVS